MSGRDLISSVVKVVKTVRKFTSAAVAVIPNEMDVEKVLLEQGKNFIADSRLWRARKGEFASYKIYLNPGEKVIFNIWSCIHRDTGRRFIQVFPVSYYKDEKLAMRVTRVEKGKQPFLSGGVLFNKFDIDRIPEKYRKELELWAQLIMEGVRRYDEKNQKFRLSRQ